MRDLQQSLHSMQHCNYTLTGTMTPHWLIVFVLATGIYANRWYLDYGRLFLRLLNRSKDP